MTSAPVVKLVADIANSVIPGCATIFLHTTVLLSLGLVVSRLIKGRGVAAQVLVLRGFLLAVIIIPVVVLVFNAAGVTRFNVPVPVERLANEEPLPPGDSYRFMMLLVDLPGEGASPVLSPEPVDADGIESVRETGHFVSYVLRMPVSHTLNPQLSARSMVYLAVVGVWMSLSVLLAGWVCYGHCRILFLRSRARDIDPLKYPQAGKVAWKSNTILPEIRRSDRVSVPFLTGVLEPIIILPEQVRITEDVIVHELGHYIRCDCLWKMLGMAVLVCVPVQPLIYFYLRRLDVVSDYLCDDFVVVNTTDPHAYALELVTYAERSCFVSSLEAVAAGVVSGNPQSTLRRRIRRILDDTFPRQLKTGRRTVAAVVTVCALATFTAAWTGFEGSMPQMLKEILPTSSFDTLIVRSPVVESETSSEPAREVAAVDEPLDLALPEESLMMAAREEEEVREELTEQVVAEAPPAERMDEEIREQTVIPVPVAEAAIPDESETGVEEITDEPQVVEEDRAVASEETVRTSLADASATTQSDKRYIPEEETIDLVDYPSYEDCMTAGIEYFDQARYFISLVLFKKALKLNPNDAEANYFIGYSYLRTHDFDKAKMFLQIAIAIKPDYDLAYYRLGDVIWNMGDLDGAWEQYKASIDINPAMSKMPRESF